MWHVSSRSGVATLPTAVDLLLTYTQLGAWLCFPLPVVALCASSWFTQCSGLWCRQHRQVVVSLRGRHHLPTAVFHSATITTRNILQVFVPPVEGFAFWIAYAVSVLKLCRVRPTVCLSRRQHTLWADMHHWLHATCGNVSLG